MLQCRRVNGKEEAVLNPIHRLPGELALLPVVFLIAFGISLSDFTLSYFSASLIGLGVGAFLTALALTYLLPSLCARAKTHTLLRNTLCFRLFRASAASGKKPALPLWRFSCISR